MEQNELSKRGADVLCRLSLRHQVDFTLAAQRGDGIPEEVGSAIQSIDGGQSFLDDVRSQISQTLLTDILDRLDPSSSARLTDELKRFAPSTTDTPGTASFAFDDLESLHINEVHEVLEHVDEHTVFLALKGSSPAIWGKVFSALSPESAVAMRRKLEISAPVPLASVYEAQIRIVSAIRNLIATGKINSPE
ncbi:MAG: hypothetical protein E4H20_10310 [Spirochaetales bacterium]|nr:MAG: hypothetical protein E4H20_10310 [Spirochaetales bacterium]